MTTKHPPGGWHRNIPPASKYPVIFAGRNKHVAQVISRGLEPDEIEANANLIAAAPDLLTALTHMMRVFDVVMSRLDMIDGDLFGEHHNDAMDAERTARAAIAKATNQEG